MKKEDVIGLLRDVGSKGLSHSSCESDVSGHPDDPGGSQSGLEDRGRAIGRSVVDREDADAGMALMRQGGQTLRQPRFAVLGHKDDEDTRHLDPLGAGVNRAGASLELRHGMEAKRSGRRREHSMADMAPRKGEPPECRKGGQLTPPSK